MLFLLLACSQEIPIAEAPTSDPSAAWDLRLHQVVTRAGNVDYESLNDDSKALEDYVAWLAVAPDTPLEGDAALARHINAYNAFVIKGVLENWPLTSVRDVSVGVLFFKGSGFFKGLKFTYDGETIDLSRFENDPIRQGFKDPRIHGAINCASAGCPPLKRGLYTPENLDAELDQAMTRLFQERSRVEDGEAVFSEIFSWWGSDFTDWTDHDDLCSYAAQYDPAFDLEGCPHRFETYDWSLNAAEPMDSEVTVSTSWDYPPSPADCPPYMTPDGEVCTQGTPFGQLDDPTEVSELLATGAFGERSLCEQGVCAPPNPTYTRCGILSKSPDCVLLKEKEARWDWLAETCHNQGVAACLPQAWKEANGE